MRRSLKAATLAAIVLLLVAMLPNHGSAFPYYTEGYVKDASGTPIPHATIEVSGPVFNVSSGNIEEASVSFEDATDSTGYFRIAYGVNEPAGFTTGDTVTLRLIDDNYTASVEFEIEGLRNWANLTVGGSNGNGDGGFDPLDFILSPVGIGIISVIVIVMVAAVYVYKTSEKSEEMEKEEARRKIGRRRQ